MNGAMAGRRDTRRSVLHVSQPGSEGVANYVRDLAMGQTEREWRVGLACPAHSRLATSASGAGLDVVSWAAEREPGLRLGRETRELASIIRWFDPDIVHLHSSKAGMVGRLALRGRRPTVFQPHAWSFQAVGGPIRRSAVWWERIGARWADAIITVSRGEQATASCNGIRAAGIDVTIPNPVDTTRFRPVGTDEEETIRLRRSLGLPTQPLVACVGRLSRQKGQDLLLLAWPMVVAAVPDAQLLLVGDGPSRGSLERAARGNVHILGDRADVPELLRAVRLVVLPSRWEGMSLALLEAMASGRSVVATDVGGAAETAGAGAGAVVPVGDVGRLAEEMIRRLLDDVLTECEGRRGRRLARERHTMDAVVQSTHDVYASVTSLRRSRSVSPLRRRAPGPVEPADV